MSNFTILGCLELVKKFSVGGGWEVGGGSKVSLVFCFGPNLDLDQAEQLVTALAEREPSLGQAGQLGKARR